MRLVLTERRKGLEGFGGRIGGDMEADSRKLMLMAPPVMEKKQVGLKSVGILGRTGKFVRLIECL